jgi:hypothetical protein
MLIGTALIFDLVATRQDGPGPSYADLDEVLERLLDALNTSFSWVGGNRLWLIPVLG